MVSSFVGVVSKPPSRFWCDNTCKNLVGSYYAVCWVFVQLDLLLYRLLGLLVQFVGSLHLDLFDEQHVGSLLHTIYTYDLHIYIYMNNM